jgi:hypothetical protein
MGEILAAPNPYALVKEADGLIRTVGEMNEALLAERRTQALETILEQSAAVRMEVTAAGGNDALKSASLAPLEKLAKRVAAQESLAHIIQAEAESVRLRDEALARVEQVLAKKAEEDHAVQDKPVLKPRRVVMPGKLVKSTYLESQADVDDFLEKLLIELNDALSNNERIEIR